jgi:hypothetical protein
MNSFQNLLGSITKITRKSGAEDILASYFLAIVKKNPEITSRIIS